MVGAGSGEDSEIDASGESVNGADAAELRDPFLRILRRIGLVISVTIEMPHQIQKETTRIDPMDLSSAPNRSN
jgi:hypothetical protein